jgi:hypothetical protein
MKCSPKILRLKRFKKKQSIDKSFGITNTVQRTILNSAVSKWFVKKKFAKYALILFKLLLFFNHISLDE